ncbi:hypothetical protein SteCoe_2456 [Stentor coeruleus]|uniref:GPS domain-containing protein n=1 Tax=Stentor coeruleus TaxID=5963 RepID=A0A1R2CZJ5_9CILI|nr:hypothetical protein SteCoe_2456 [Stentor coeruleus]
MIIFLLAAICAGFDLENSQGTISWPLTSWAISPISSYSWHAGDAVALTLVFNPSVDLVSGVVQISFPTAFSTKKTLDITDVVAGEDKEIVVDGITLPIKGVYGPIGITLRVSATGNIVASNELFANVYVTSAKPTAVSNSLTATFYDITKVYITDSSSIYFDFSITQDLWKYDTFYLYIDSHFTMTTPICKSLKVIGEYNNLNSTNPSSLNTLSCYYDSEHSRVVIYGLGVDVNVDKLSSTGSITGRLLINGFKNPGADYDDSVYSWQLYIGRFSVNAFFAAYTGSGPSTQTGSISVTSWLPYSGYDVNKIVLGLTLYMDLTVTFSHDIPKTGEIYFKFSGGVDNDSKSWRNTDGTQNNDEGDKGYFLVTPYIGGTCDVAATTISCTDFPQDIPAGTYVFTTFTNFISTSPSVMEIMTYADILKATPIDEVTANPASVIYANYLVANLLDDFQFYFAETLNVASDINYNSQASSTTPYLVIHTKAPLAMDGEDIKIYSPVSSSDNENNIKITGTLSGTYLTTDTYTTDLTTATTSLTGASFSSGSITYTAPTVTSANYLSSLFSATSIAFPHVSSNLYTRYEVRAEITLVLTETDSDGVSTDYNVLHVYSKSVTFIPNDPGLDFKLFCSDSGVKGIPVELSFTPDFSYSAPSSSTMYIDITITGDLTSDLDSELNANETFPFSSSFTGSLYLSDQSTASLFWTGFSSIPASTVSIKFPFGSMTHLSNYGATLTIYYISDDRQDIKNVILSSTSNTEQSQTNTADWSKMIITSATSYETSYSISSLDITLNSATPNVAGFLGLRLPQGYRVSNSQSISQTSSMSGVYKFTSDNIYFATPGIYGSLDVNNALASSDLTFTFGGIITAHYAQSSLSKDIIPIQASDTVNQACVSITGTYPTITLGESEIVTPIFTPSAGTGAGPGNLQIDISATFYNTHFIPKTGSIRFQLASGWAVTSVSTLILLVNSEDITSTVIGSLADFSITGLPEISEGSSITIYIGKAVPPKITSATATSKGHFSYIATYASADNTQKIDRWTDGSSDSILLEPSPASGNCTFNLIDLFPNSTSTSAFIRFLFSCDNDLPAGGSFVITWPGNSWVNTGDISTSVSFSLLYSACTISGTILTITLAEDYLAGSIIEAVLDHALKLENSGELSKIGLKSTYSTLIIDSNDDIDNTYIIGDSFTEVEANVTVYPITASTLANYTFYVTGSFPVNSELKIVFPLEFNPLIGKVVETFKITNPGLYYLTCSSDLGKIQCPIVRRVVTITIPKQITTTAKFVLTGVMNPAYKTSYSNIKMYLTSTDGTVYSNELIELSGIVALPSTLIEFRKVELTNHNLQKNSDFTFKFVMTYSMKSGDYLMVTFPEMFDLERDSGNTFTCTLQYIDSAGDLSIYNSVNNTGKCLNVKNNIVALEVTQDMTWTSSLILVLVIKGILNPEWGLTMETSLDSNVYTIYDVWTTQFVIKVLSGSSFVVSTYRGLSTAYTGFNKNLYSFEVNSYDPLTHEGTITLIPGTQSQDIYITTSSFQSKVVILNPSNVNNNVALKYSSQKSFKIFNGGTYVTFRVSAPISSIPSLNYITWAIDEMPLEDNLAKYVAPVKTRIEVYSGTVTITTGKVLAVPIGSTSLPVSINLPLSPDTSLTIEMSTTSVNVTISPTSLTFTPGINTLYYSVSVLDGYSIGTSTKVVIDYKLSGTDSKAYNISSTTLSVSEAGSSPITIKSIKFSSVSKTTMTVSVTTDIITTACWEFGDVRSEFMSYNDIINSTASLVGENNMPSFEEQVSTYFDSVENNGEGWKSNQRATYKDFLKQTFTGCAFSGTTTITLFSADWLWAETYYKITVYAGSEDSNMTAYQSTSAFGESLDITIKIDQSVDKSYLSKILSGLAGSLGIEQDQLTLVSSDLQDTKSTIIERMYPDRTSALSPSDIYKVRNDEVLITALQSIGIIATPILSSTSISRKVTISPSFEGAEVFSTSAVSVTVHLNLTQDGEICCLALSEDEPDLNSTQILLGLNSINQDGSYACVSDKAYQNTSLSISGLVKNREYNFTCVACNNYPVWPACGDISKISVKTSGTSDGGDTKISFGSLVALSWSLLSFI